MRGHPGRRASMAHRARPSARRWGGRAAAAVRRGAPASAVRGRAPAAAVRRGARLPPPRGPATGLLSIRGWGAAVDTPGLRPSRVLTTQLASSSQRVWARHTPGGAPDVVQRQRCSPPPTSPTNISLGVWGASGAGVSDPAEKVGQRATPRHDHASESFRVSPRGPPASASHSDCITRVRAPQRAAHAPGVPPSLGAVAGLQIRRRPRPSRPRPRGDAPRVSPACAAPAPSARRVGAAAPAAPSRQSHRAARSAAPHSFAPSRPCPARPPTSRASRAPPQPR